jgi:hypothetical protein
MYVLPLIIALPFRSISSLMKAMEEAEPLWVEMSIVAANVKVTTRHYGN